MQLIYTPDGQESQRWPIDLGKLRVQECEAIEKRTGLAYGTEYKEALLKGGTAARRALLWTLLRRDHPRTRYEDVDFADGELVLEFDLGEYHAMRAAVADDATLTDDDRARGLAVLDQAIAEAEAAAAADVDLVDVSTVEQGPGSEYLPGKALPAS